MSKSVSIPQALSELRKGSTLRRKSTTNRRKIPNAKLPLTGFVIFIVGRSGRILLYGTPADRAGISIGDEIIGVNEWTPERKTKEEVIEHVQECIRTRVIQLRVRRKIDDTIETDLKLGLAKVTDAFLVSVERNQVKSVMKTLMKKYPDARALDMETIAQQQTQFASIHNGRALSAESIERRPDLQEIEKTREKQKEHEFLRSSLRQSKKLRSLENKADSKGNLEIEKTPEKGYNNPSFTETTMKNERDFAENNNESIALKQVIHSVDRLAEHLAKMEGREEEGNLLRQYFSNEGVRRAIEQATTHTQQPSTSSQTSHNEKDGKPMKIVVLRKDPDSYLGATVRNEGDRVIVGRVVRGGIVERTATIREGDELLEINGLPLKGKTVAEVCDLMRVMSGEIRFVVSPCSETDTPQPPTYVQHLRALFDYDPEDDVYVPCKELALKFQRGDILHVINTTDENWWQAYREGDDPSHSLAGLVPSSSFHQQVVMYTDELEKEKRPKCRKEARKRLPEVLKGLRRRKSNEMRSSADEEGLGTACGYHSDMLTYEEVVLHLARSERKRPIILCGPEGVGCLELRKTLIEEDKERLGGVVPHTTRAPIVGENDGVHYHFVSRTEFQDDVKAGSFIEWGEFEKNLYGTSVKEVKAVIKRGNTCVLTLKPESLSLIRNADLQPFIIFIAPPSLIVLRRQKETERAKIGESSAPVRDEQLKATLNQGKAIEQKFGHLFDHIIVNMDFDRSLAELKTVIRKVENEPQWVPAAWLAQQQL
ncbi:unnamed protein product, partial [Mesorhabditis belari]|uniref:MAGUK p55 subfamily member 5 n=1 Tax=Mesorhabditis belari TaxID=2138241 RepID=A0AAF3ESK2_9BILA